MAQLAHDLKELDLTRPASGASNGRLPKCPCSPACLHVAAETANLALTLHASGAELRLCASNPLSTQDDGAAARIARPAIPTFALRGESTEGYHQHIDAALEHRPQLTLDDGADLVSRLHAARSGLLAEVIGGMEETTNGVIRLRAMVREGTLRHPVIAVNDAKSKYFFDNRYGNRPEHARRHAARYQYPCSRALCSPSPATAGAGAASSCAHAARARR